MLLQVGKKAWTLRPFLPLSGREQGVDEVRMCIHDQAPYYDDDGGVKAAFVPSTGCGSGKIPSTV
jgi:hypothetical protein